MKPSTRNHRTTTIRSVDRPRSSTNRSTARSITGRNRRTEHDDSGSFGKKTKNSSNIAKATTHRTKKEKPAEPKDPLTGRYTRRRIVTEIETEYNDDKKSFFDEEAYRRFIVQQPEVEAEESPPNEEQTVLQAVLVIQRAWRAHLRRKQLKRLSDFRLKLNADFLTKTL